MSVREEKKEAKRQEIFTKAMTLFETYGFDQVTVAQIAEVCGIAKKTLFQYIKSKEALIFVNDRELLDQLLSALTAWNYPWEDFQKWVLTVSLDEDETRFLSLPQLIDTSETLKRRLLEMWQMYELEIAQALTDQKKCAALDSKILANKMVLVFRLSFEKIAPLKTILKQLK